MRGVTRRVTGRVGVAGRRVRPPALMRRLRGVHGQFEKPVKHILRFLSQFQRSPRQFIHTGGRDAAKIVAYSRHDEARRTAMELSSNAADVMLIDEVARVLKITPKQIRRLERRGAFPIPRLPKLDRHPRYSRALVKRFALGGIPAADDPPTPRRVGLAAKKLG